MAIKYIQTGDELPLHSATSFDDDSAEGWWGGVFQCGVSIVLAAAMAVGAQTATAQTQWTYEQDDTVSVAAQAFQPDEDFWQNPVAPVWSYPVKIFTDDDIIVPQPVVTFHPDEDYWQNPVPPVPASFWQPLPLLWTTGGAADQYISRRGLSMSVPQNFTIKLTNGKPAMLGFLSATQTQNLQFVIPEPCRDFQGFCIVQGVGTITSPTAILEGSIDGGNTWFSLTTSTNIVLGIASLLSGDTPAGSADAFQVNGMGAGCLFRFGYTQGSITGNITVWAMVG